VYAPSLGLTWLDLALPSCSSCSSLNVQPPFTPSFTPSFLQTFAPSFTPSFTPPFADVHSSTGFGGQRLGGRVEEDEHDHHHHHKRAVSMPVGALPPVLDLT
jgi:hypothetical protein